MQTGLQVNGGSGLRRLNGRRVNSRMVLMAGFGGLLMLMAFAQIDGIDALRQIESASDNIRDGFLLRTRQLERIRGDLYVSGTYIRDYLLEREPGKAEGHRYSLLETRGDMDEALREYSELVNTQEMKLFKVLTGELSEYWKVLEPVMHWSPEQRQKSGYVFLRDEVFPRRMAMLRIADQIGTLNESELKTGSAKLQVVFAQFRSRLRTVIWLTIGLGLALASFSIHQILRLETETAARYREIADARAELKELSARLVEAQENERRSISRELHDEVGQALTAILVEMANLSNLIRTRDTEALRAKAGEIKRLVENSIRVVRNMALLLRPSMLDDLGLVPALEWQAREVSKRGGLRVKVTADDVSEELPEELKTCVYRIVQEALHNCIKHSNAHEVNIAVRQESGRLLLSLADDGKGFDPHADRGLGLLGMQERVSHLGGKFEVKSQPGRGTMLTVSLPVGETQKAGNV